MLPPCETDAPATKTTEPLARPALDTPLAISKEPDPDDVFSSEENKSIDPLREDGADPVTRTNLPPDLLPPNPLRATILPPTEPTPELPISMLSPFAEIPKEGLPDLIDISPDALPSDTPLAIRTTPLELPEDDTIDTAPLDALKP